MLIYHPAFDAYHCVYRIVAITNSIPELELAKLRILDYYLCFPAEVAKIELPQSHGKFRSIARNANNKFRGPVSPLRTFRDLEAIQLAATRLLVASKVFDFEKLETGIVTRTSWLTPPSLKAAANPVATVSPELTEYILTQLSKLPLGGLGGLKQRTGLMEYRYDSV